MSVMSRRVPVQIAGLGKHLPERVVRNAELEAQLGLKDGWIERLTGVRERRRAPVGAATSEMAADAARMALSRAGLTADDLDLIVGASSAPQQLIPCTAALVQRALGAPEGKSACFDVSATCLSFLAAMQVVAPLLASGVYKTALIFCAEAPGFSLNPDEPESATLIGDAAAAAVLRVAPAGSGSALDGIRLATFAASGAELTRVRGAGSRHHPADPSSTPDLCHFEMQGPRVYRLASKLYPPFLDSFLADQQIDRDKLDLVVPHQASSMGIRGIIARTRLPAEKTYVNLPERGNCIAASLPLALCEAWEENRLRPGMRVLLAGTGAGLTLGAGLLTF